MRNFWGFYDNGNYRVGCNGATIYVYNQNNEELGKFRDIKYAYTGTFQPDTNIFVAKSTEGSLAVYDLDKMTLLKKIVITRIGGQDEGFAFSPNASYFFNIEKPFCALQTQLTIYRTTDYEIEKVLFSNNKSMMLVALEFDKFSDDCYVLGYMREKQGIMDYGFIGKLLHDDIAEIMKLSQDEYDCISKYKLWELSGFTSRALQWSYIKNPAQGSHISLKQVYKEKKCSCES